MTSLCLAGPAAAQAADEATYIDCRSLIETATTINVYVSPEFRAADSVTVKDYEARHRQLAAAAGEAGRNPSSCWDRPRPSDPKPLPFTERMGGKLQRFQASQIPPDWHDSVRPGDARRIVPVRPRKPVAAPSLTIVDKSAERREGERKEAARKLKAEQASIAIAVARTAGTAEARANFQRWLEIERQKLKLRGRRQ